MQVLYFIFLIFTQYKTDISTVAPITQPLLIPNQPSQVPAPLFPGMQIQNQHTADQNFQSLPQIYPVEGMNMDAARGYFQPPQSGNTVNYQNFNSFVSGSQQQFVPYAEDAIHPPPVEEETQKQKPPLPEEFIYLQTVFDELKTQCSIKATNPVSLSINHTLYEKTDRPYLQVLTISSIIINFISLL